jgi:hypothetical protein
LIAATKISIATSNRLIAVTKVLIATTKHLYRGSKWRVSGGLDSTVRGRAKRPVHALTLWFQRLMSPRACLTRSLGPFVASSTTQVGSPLPRRVPWANPVAKKCVFNYRKLRAKFRRETANCIVA